MPVAMLAYTGVETVSNLAEEVRDPVKNVPNAYKLVAAGGLRDLLHAAAGRALGAAGDRDRRRADDAAGAAAGGGRLRERSDPRASSRTSASRGAARRARDLRRHPRRDDPLHRHERRRHRRFTDHILDGDLPADPGGLPPAAPALQDAVALDRALRRRRPDRGDPAGQRQLRRHALLVRSDALVHDRARVDRADADATPKEELLYRARPNLRIGAIDWPLFAIFGGIATGISFAVIVVQNPATRWVGLGWIVDRPPLLRRYRRRFVHAPLTETVKAPPAYGPALALEYRRLLVPVARRPGIGRGTRHRRRPRGRARRPDHGRLRDRDAARPAARADLPAEEALANRELDEASAIGDVVRRHRDPAARARAQCRRRDRRARRSGVRPRSSSSARRGRTFRAASAAIFGRTVDYVLKNATCRVLVTAVKGAAA